jgi:hypothetical protein
MGIMKLKRILHKALVGVGVMILAVSILGAKEVLAVCNISPPKKLVSGLGGLPTSWCHSAEGSGGTISTACGEATINSNTGFWSWTQAVYSCGTDIDGADYCWCHVEACDTACAGGGGGGPGHTPIWNGSHDVYFGVQPAATCRASGWIIDNYWGVPSDHDVTIHIKSDGNEIYSGVASGYRGDLTSYCTNGTCAFDVDLNGLISYGVPHNITITAANTTYMLPAMDYTVAPPVARNMWQRVITCTEPATNSPPQGTLTCPASPIYLGQSASFTLNGSDSDGNLSRADFAV